MAPLAEACTPFVLEPAEKDRHKECKCRLFRPFQWDSPHKMCGRQTVAARPDRVRICLAHRRVQQGMARMWSWSQCLELFHSRNGYIHPQSQ